MLVDAHVEERPAARRDAHAREAPERGGEPIDARLQLRRGDGREAVRVVGRAAAVPGPIAAIEAWMGRRSADLGWRPEFPIEQVLGRPELKLVGRRPAKAFDLFTLLVFERI